MNFLFFLVNLAIVCFASWGISKRLTVSMLERILMLFVFWWANAIITAIILSGFGLLGAPEAYFLVSTLFQFGLYMAASMSLPMPLLNSKLDLQAFIGSWRQDLLRHEKIFIIFVCSVGNNSQE